MRASGIAPERSTSTSSSASTWTTVLGTPPFAEPPSITRSSSVGSSRSTPSAVVAGGLPERLADGTSSGTPASRTRPSASGCEGSRKPVMWPSASRSTSVSAPGQKRSMSRSAAAGIFGHRRRTSATSATMTVMGLSFGRPLIA
jgi:hypothetical protein